MSLLACPFCREMFEHRERHACPVCGVPLVAFETLPLSADALGEDGTPHEPEWDPLPVAFAGRGRGALALIAVLGLVAFFLPWVHETIPDELRLTGFALARRLGWAWGAGVGWFVLLPIVLTRRSIMQMRGARVAASFLAAVPGITAALLLLRPPHGSPYVPLRFSWELGIWGTAALSAIAIGFAVTFGGRLDDIALRRGSSAGQVVH